MTWRKVDWILNRILFQNNNKVVGRILGLIVQCYTLCIQVTVKIDGLDMLSCSTCWQLKTDYTWVHFRCSTALVTLCVKLVICHLSTSGWVFVWGGLIFIPLQYRTQNFWSSLLLYGVNKAVFILPLSLWSLSCFSEQEHLCFIEVDVFLMQ